MEVRDVLRHLSFLPVACVITLLLFSIVSARIMKRRQNVANRVSFHKTLVSGSSYIFWNEIFIYHTITAAAAAAAATSDRKGE